MRTITSFRLLFVSLMAHFDNPHTMYKECKETVAGYSLVKPVLPDTPVHNFAVGIYAKNNTPYFIKTWENKERDLTYYSALYEFQVSGLLSRKFKEFSEQVRVPEAIEIVHNSDNSISFVYEYVGGFLLSKRGVSEQLRHLEKIISELVYLSSTLTKEEKSQLRSRGILFYLFCLPLCTILSVRSNPSKWRKILKACLHCALSLKIQRALVLSHRDLHPGNVILADNLLYMVDCEYVALTIPGFDWSDLGIFFSNNQRYAQSMQGCSANSEFLKTYIAIHRSATSLEPNRYKQYLFATYA
ncbi:phosphotransferase [Candidatus Roizmanbacteria bacterium]|nr:phosphotransferase [Candidatus Roizmanbacteria bacterium]